MREYLPEYILWAVLIIFPIALFLFGVFKFWYNRRLNRPWTKKSKIIFVVLLCLVPAVIYLSYALSYISVIFWSLILFGD